MKIEELAERVAGVEAAVKRINVAPRGGKVKRTPSNGRPDVCCFICGGERGEIQHTGDGKMTIICPECGSVYRLLVEILRKPNADCLCDKGLSDTCLGLCGDTGPDGGKDPLARMKKDK